MVTDVTSLESVEALRDATLERYGAVHLVCNNAGIGSGSEGQLWEHHVNDWRWSLDVNVMGVVNGIHAFVPTLLAQGEEGHVVNTTSSNGGFTPLINSAVYATTKAAVTTITECLWGQLREVGAKVSASLLYPSTFSPGMLNTGIWRPGANRPERYDRPGAPPKEGRDAARRLPAAHGGGRDGGAVRTLVRGGRHLLRGDPQRHVLDHRPQRPATTEDPGPRRVTDRRQPPRVPSRSQPDDVQTDRLEELTGAERKVEDPKKREQTSMIRMSVLYPTTEGYVFDHDYYRDHHVPLALRTWGLERAEIDKGVDGPYVAAVHFRFDSLEAMTAALSGEGSTQVTADVANYTNITPVVQISEIV